MSIRIADAAVIFVILILLFRTSAILERLTRSPKETLKGIRDELPMPLRKMESFGPANPFRVYGYLRLQLSQGCASR